MKRNLIAMLSLFLAPGVPAPAQDAASAPPTKGAQTSYPPVNVAPEPHAGKNIQRAMRLMATSTPANRNTVRVLFYGQSITEQKWWRIVADDLKRRFPHADLVIENRAIGGFASQMLVKDAEAALYSFQPDLVIFHVYGAHDRYEDIIRRLRERTTADILIQTDHVTKDEHLTEETDPAKISPSGPVWDQFMNHVHLPNVARKYGTGLADVRGGWKAYLKQHNLSARALLSDAVHLNDHGCFVMAELVKRALILRSDVPQETDGRVRTVAVGKGVKWEKGRLTLPFTGNRVDLLGAGGGGPLRVLIDGKPPSAHPSCYAFTRATVYPGTPWPVVMRVQHETPLLLEDWTVRIKDGSEDLKQFRFEVVGSKTGPDGEGTSDKRFVSKSGRVVIEPDDWGLARSRDFTKKPLPEGFVIRFSVVPLFQDTYTPPAPRGPGLETAVTVAQNLPNGPHTLELINDAARPVTFEAIRIHRPPLPAAPAAP